MRVTFIAGNRHLLQLDGGQPGTKRRRSGSRASNASYTYSESYSDDVEIKAPQGGSSSSSAAAHTASFFSAHLQGAHHNRIPLRESYLPDLITFLVALLLSSSGLADWGRHALLVVRWISSRGGSRYCPHWHKIRAQAACERFDLTNVSFPTATRHCDQSDPYRHRPYFALHFAAGLAETSLKCRWFL